MNALFVAVAVATIGCHGCGAPAKCGHVVKADCAPVTITLPKICLPKIELPKLDCLKIKCKPVKCEKKVVKCEKKVIKCEKKVVKKCLPIKKIGGCCLLGGLGIHKIGCKAVKAEKAEAPKPAPAPEPQKPAPAPAPAPAPEKPAPQPKAEQK